MNDSRVPDPAPDSLAIGLREGGIVRLYVDLVLDPGARFGMTSKVHWWCGACRRGEDVRDVPAMLTVLSRHAFGHHHRGAGALP